LDFKFDPRSLTRLLGVRVVHSGKSVHSLVPVGIVADAVRQERSGNVRAYKYEPLQAHLQRRRGRPEMLTFEDIEAIIGAGLPQSAVKHRAFWANDNKAYHSHTRSWMGAGYRVAYVDRDEKVVRFERTR
jgi:hypothetical protein